MGIVLGAVQESQVLLPEMTRPLLWMKTLPEGK